MTHSNLHTDLALEARQIAAPDAKQIPGVRFSDHTQNGVHIDVMDITSQ